MISQGTAETGYPVSAEQGDYANSSGTGLPFSS